MHLSRSINQNCDFCFIEEATDGSQASENWAVFLEICDIINDTDDGGKDAIRAIKKRLQQYAGKNYKIIMFTLTVILYNQLYLFIGLVFIISEIYSFSFKKV